MNLYLIRFYIAVVFFTLFITSCDILGNSGDDKECLFETGIASWYGEDYHGTQTASGEIYDMESLTAAHKTLPFGTIVRVKRIDNEREVTVRINNRGPFVEGRVIDLSRKAARELDMLTDGITEVELYLAEGQESLEEELICAE